MSEFRPMDRFESKRNLYLTESYVNPLDLGRTPIQDGSKLRAFEKFSTQLSKAIVYTIFYSLVYERC